MPNLFPVYVKDKELRWRQRLNVTSKQRRENGRRHRSLEVVLMIDVLEVMMNSFRQGAHSNLIKRQLTYTHTHADTHRFQNANALNCDWVPAGKSMQLQRVISGRVSGDDEWMPPVFLLSSEHVALITHWLTSDTVACCSPSHVDCHVVRQAQAVIAATTLNFYNYWKCIWQRPAFTDVPVEHTAACGRPCASLQLKKKAWLSQPHKASEELFFPCCCVSAGRTTAFFTPGWIGTANVGQVLCLTSLLLHWLNGGKSLQPGCKTLCEVFARTALTYLGQKLGVVVRLTPMFLSLTVQISSGFVVIRLCTLIWVYSVFTWIQQDYNWADPIVSQSVEAVIANVCIVILYIF